jgi:glutamine synthetase adenylyltransferase
MTASHNMAKQASAQPKVFKGLLTQLLHEAFYLEEESFCFEEEDRAYVEEDESDQFDVIRQLLGSLTPS